MLKRGRRNWIIILLKFPTINHLRLSWHSFRPFGHSFELIVDSFQHSLFSFCSSYLEGETSGLLVIPTSIQYILGIFLAHGTSTRIVRHLSFNPRWVIRNDNRDSLIRGSLHVSISALLYERRSNNKPSKRLFFITSFSCLVWSNLIWSDLSSDHDEAQYDIACINRAGFQTHPTPAFAPIPTSIIPGVNLTLNPYLPSTSSTREEDRRSGLWSKSKTT